MQRRSTGVDCGSSLVSFLLGLLLGLLSKLSFLAVAMTTTTSTVVRVRKVAIIGGGITGAVVATELHAQNPTLQIVVFDQGRRGPGGRASHRSVNAVTQQVMLSEESPDDDGTTFEFDHGCQFFRADSRKMQELVQEWMHQGLVAPWQGRWGRITPDTTHGFFGLPNNNNNETVYVGVGGMHQIPRQLLLGSSQPANLVVHAGTRVGRVTPSEDGGWDLWGTSGSAAFHDTPESSSSGTAAAQILDTADAVIVTDISASQDMWHRASAGLPQDFVQEHCAHFQR